MKRLHIFPLFFLFLNTILFAQKTELMIPKGHGRGGDFIAYSSDEKTLYSLGGTIKVWDIQSGKLIKTIAETQGVFGIQMISIPNQQSIGYCTYADGKFFIASAPLYKPRLVTTLPYGFNCTSLIASPDGQSILIAGGGFEGQFYVPIMYKLNISTGAYAVFSNIAPYTNDPKVRFKYNTTEITTDGRYIMTYISSSSTEQPNPNYHLLDASTGAVVRSWTAEKDASYRVMGKNLLKRNFKTLGDVKYEITAREVILPDMREGSPIIFPTSNAYMWLQINDFYDEAAKTYTYVTSEGRSNFNLVKVDMTTGRLLQSLHTNSETKDVWISINTYLPKSKKILLGYSSPQKGSGIHVVDAKTLKSEKMIGDIEPYNAASITYNPTADALLMVGSSSEIKTFEFGKSSGIIKTNRLKGNTAKWSPDGTKLGYIDESTKTAGVLDAQNLSAIPKTTPYTANLIAIDHDMAWRPDSKKFTFGRLSMCLEVDALTPSTQIRYIGNQGYEGKTHLYSKNGQYIIQPTYRYDDGSNLIGRESNFLICYSAASGSKVWESSYTSKGGLLPIAFIDNDKTLVAIEGNTRTLQYFDVANGQHKGSFGDPVNNAKVPLFNYLLIKSTNLSTDATKCVVQGEGKLMIYDFVTKTKVAELPVSSPIGGLSFIRQDKFLAYAIQEAVKIIDIEKKKEVASITLLSKKNEWVVTTPEGRFDASQGAQDIMYYVKGDQTIPLNALFEKFYTPKLLHRVLDGETFDPAPVDVNTLKEAPTVKISIDNTSRNLVVADDVSSITVEKEQINIRVQADCPSDAVTEIRLFQNGKLVQTTRNLTVEDDNAGEKTMTKTFSVFLNDGENHFKTLAFNTQRTESQPAELIVNYRVPKASNAPKPNTPPAGGQGGDGIQLHLVVIGINKYKNPKHNLNYAIADATSFKEAIEKGSSTIFSKANVVFINDENAIKSNISTELDKVKTNASPKDVFIFYYAGHGVMNDKKEFYLVPHDVTQLYGNDGALAQKGLSANQLQQYSKDIKAQKQLFILDACQSAAALENVVAARGAAEEKAIAQLARATGTHWLTASGSEQFASEFTQLGHGTFTYVLLEALSGKADTGDKKITVKEIDGYLQERVPEVTAKYKGTPQYPASYGYGNDFPIGVVKN
jgi:WD40 repeat protein